GRHRFTAGGVSLELVVGEARDAAAGLPEGAFDAVYLDPFSPRANPDAWEEDLLALLLRALRPGGRLVSYSVSGEVRRRLAGAGARVSNATGPPGGKRESLVAERPGCACVTPWSSAPGSPACPWRPSSRRGAPA